MSNYDSIRNRLTFEEARLAALATQATATRALIAALKADLADAEPEAVKINQEDGDNLPLVEVRDEAGQEVLVFTDGKTSKIVTVKK